jgi:uncharacterized protein
LNSNPVTRWTPLIISSSRGHIEVVRLLLDNGAPVDVRDNRGKSALYMATQKKHQEIRKLLLERGASDA